MQEKLIIRGAREHNLKDVSLDLPRDSLIVFTGLSGSGQVQPRLRHDLRRGPAPLRRVAVGVRAPVPRPDGQARRRLHRGAVARRSRSTRSPRRKNPRSTVGTITEVYDYLRLLYARAGRPHCPACGAPIERQTPAADRRPGPGPRGGHAGSRCWPRSSAAARASTSSCSASSRPQGFSRARVDGETHPLDGPAQARQAEEAHHRGGRRPARGQGVVQAASHRLRRDRAQPRRRARLFDFVDLPAKDPGREMKFSEKMACPNDHPIDTDELEPRSFSFNSPFGACPECHGLGTRMEVDPELVVPDPQATLGEGAIQPWSQAHVADYFLRLMGALGDELGFDLNTPWEDLPAKARSRILDGHADQGPRRHPQPLRPRARLLRRVRGRPHLRRAAPRRGRVRHQPRAVRGLHARGAVPRLPGQPAQAGQPGGDARRPGRRRQEHRRGLPPPDQRDRRLPARASSSPRASGRSASGCSRRSRSGSTSCSTSASTTSRSTGPPGRCPAARRSGSGWPPRSAPGWSASSTSSTSPRSGSTSATTSG